MALPVIPSMWREELLHPLLAHFPIALLPAAFLFRATYWIARGRANFAFLLPASRVLLVLGVAGAWVAVFTGEIAEDVVNRVICDPTVTQSHEEMSKLASLAFSGALAVDLFFAWFKRATLKIENAAMVVTAIAMAAGSLILIRTGHLGASLVYQQGAGVYHPSPECQEFE